MQYIEPKVSFLRIVRLLVNVLFNCRKRCFLWARCWPRHSVKSMTVGCRRNQSPLPILESTGILQGKDAYVMLAFRFVTKCIALDRALKTSKVKIIFLREICCRKSAVYSVTCWKYHQRTRHRIIRNLHLSKRRADHENYTAYYIAFWVM